MMFALDHCGQSSTKFILPSFLSSRLSLGIIYRLSEQIVEALYFYYCSIEDEVTSIRSAPSLSPSPSVKYS